MTALKSLLFLIFVPGTVAVYIPLFLLQRGARVETGIFSYIAYPLWIGGTIILLWCFWDFLAKGRGTPAPTDPPKELVLTGLYRLIRNPMYDGVLLVILGHFLWFESWSLILYAMVVFAAFHTFVTMYEEPHLKKTFGQTYEDYCKRVPRWIPKLHSAIIDS